MFFQHFVWAGDAPSSTLRSMRQRGLARRVAPSQDRLSLTARAVEANLAASTGSRRAAPGSRQFPLALGACQESVYLIVNRYTVV